MRITHETDVRIFNEHLLKRWADELAGPKMAKSLPTALYATAINPFTPPGDAGYSIAPESHVTKADAGLFTIRITADVADPAKVRAEAISRYQACWQDTDWAPQTVGEALHELLIASNASPSPDACGIEIVDRRFIDNFAFA